MIFDGVRHTENPRSAHGTASIGAVLVLFLALSLVPAPPVLASQLDLDQPIALSLKGADLTQVLRSFAVIVGAEPDLAPDVAGTVSIEVSNVPWREAVDSLCVEQALNCELLYGEPTRLRVRSLGALPGFALQPGLAQNIDIELRGAALGQVFESLAMITDSEIAVDEGVTGAYTMFLGKAPWSIVFEEACDLHDCRVLWDQEPIQVVPTETASERRASLDLEEAPLSVVLASLPEMDLWGPFAPVVVEDAGSLPGTVTLDLQRASWVEILQALCQQAGCAWRLEYGNPSRLRVFPAENQAQGASAGGSGPPPGSQGLEVTATLRVDGQPDLTETLQFTWASPLAFLDQDEIWAHLAWLPFGPGASVVAPILVDCRADVPLPALLGAGQPPTVPWSASSILRARLELAMPGDEAPEARRDPGQPAPCLSPGAGRIRTRLLDRQMRPVGPPVVLDLPARVGTYLLIAPPGRATPPKAAVIHLGPRDDQLRLALVESRQGRQGIHHLVLEPGSPHLHQLTPDDSRASDPLTLEIVFEP